MVVDRKLAQFNIPILSNRSLCEKADVLVLNNSKVIPARLVGIKPETGGKIEVLLVRPNVKNLKNYQWSKEWFVIGKPGLKRDKNHLSAWFRGQSYKSNKL